MNTELDTVLASQPPIVSKALPADKKKRKPAAKKVAAKKAPAKKAPAKKPAAKKVAAKKADAAGKTKAQHARELYAKISSKPRQEILKQFIEKVGLTPAGANTYLANCKRDAG